VAWLVIDIVFGLFDEIDSFNDSFAFHYSPPPLRTVPTPMEHFVPPFRFMLR